MPGVTLKDVSAADFIKAYAAHLKRAGKLELPRWVDIVKTGVHKELPPSNPDWYFVRAAAIARRVYLRPGIGLGGFKKIFGGAKRRGTRPSHFQTASGSIVRHILKQLERVKVVEKDPKGKGRKLTAKGQRDLDRIAGQIVHPATPAAAPTPVVAPAATSDAAPAATTPATTAAPTAAPTKAKSKPKAAAPKSS
eukprot:TRINITY_DN152_c0_g1_i1.p1 TRINITY_DN152_c0_g1~~TRINITY_DN152_c0_g1_i1.p1  ORF type:complete len:194 (+),score=69.35 TRINITY_DN152_c0_g1_i1:53-634(+)